VSISQAVPDAAGPPSASPKTAAGSGVPRRDQKMPMTMSHSEGRGSIVSTLTCGFSEASKGTGAAGSSQLTSRSFATWSTKGSYARRRTTSPKAARSSSTSPGDDTKIVIVRAAIRPFLASPASLRRAASPTT
jgi:hypothetical protein